MKTKTAKYITVLDFEIGRVFQYKVKSSDFGPHLLEYYDSDDYEKFITDKGHRLSNCEWMVHDIAGIIKNNDSSYGKL
jgi:hypothetical protein